MFVQRITIPEILEDGWFKKGFRPPSFQQEEDVNVDDVDAAFNYSEVGLLFTFLFPFLWDEKVVLEA